MEVEIVSMAEGAAETADIYRVIIDRSMKYPIIKQQQSAQCWTQALSHKPEKLGVTNKCQLYAIDEIIDIKTLHI